jgi:hypothetical protein
MSNDGWPPYSYLDKVAAEARKASRRYWAKGGEADRKYPQQASFWPVAEMIREEEQQEPQTERGLPG